MTLSETKNLLVLQRRVGVFFYYRMQMRYNISVEMHRSIVTRAIQKKYILHLLVLDFESFVLKRSKQYYIKTFEHKKINGFFNFIFVKFVISIPKDFKYELL